MALISLLLLAALLPQLGHSASVNVGIVNGTVAKPHSRPYMVSLQERTRHFCGGFLVSERFVMTAAHCKDKVKNWKDVTAVIGAHNLKTDSDFQRIQLTEKHSHPGFTNNTYKPANDIMLLKLAKPVVNPSWISIPEKEQDIEQGTTCSVAGWGRTKNSGPANDVLLEAEVTMLSSKKCEDELKCPNTLCTVAGHGGFCAGDSGGPLVCNNTAVGVIAFYVKDCVSPKKPYGYTKISGFLPWIRGIIGKMK